MQPIALSIHLTAVPTCVYSTFQYKEGFVDYGKIVVNKFLAEQFHFGGSWLSTGTPRQHFRACAWIEGKKPR